MTGHTVPPAARGLTALETIDLAVERLKALLADLPAGTPRQIYYAGLPALAWCADHDSRPDTWCRRCSIHTVRIPALAALWGAFTPTVLGSLADWLLAASIREANYQASRGSRRRPADDLPNEGEEAYDALQVALAVLDSGPADLPPSAGPGGPDG